MSNNHLVKVILPEFIKVLENYNEFYGRFRASVDWLYRAKHMTATELLGHLKEIYKTGDATNIDFDPIDLERAPSRQTDLTQPSSNDKTSDWVATPLQFLTPPPLLIQSSTITVSDEDWPPNTPIITENSTNTEETDSLSDLIRILLRQRKEIHKARSGYRTGSLDGILYAMSRNLYFIQWFYDQIIPYIPVESPDESVEGINANQKHCLDLLWLIATYMCKYSYDRACKSWDNHHINKLKRTNYSALEQKYYLCSGIYDLPNVDDSYMLKLDNDGNRMVNLLILLSLSYFDLDESRQLTTLHYILRIATNHIGKDFLGKIECIYNQLPASSSVIPVDVPSEESMKVFDSKRDEDITLEAAPIIKPISPSRHNSVGS